MPTPPPPPSLIQRLPLSLRRTAFRVLEALAARRQGRHRATPEPAIVPEPQPSLWLFVSTIGELNAIAPFLQLLRQQMGTPPLTLISDRNVYTAAYRSRHPDAGLVVSLGSHAELAALVRARPPRLLLVAEIPARLHDAPCRLSFETLHIARQAGAPVVLVNGWLYGYAPPSRLDAIENVLFARDYVRAFDLMLVQTEAVRQRLLADGALPQHVHVTGNIKFDAMPTSADPAPPTPLERALLARRARGPVIVAGSVTETADQQGLIEAFSAVLARHAGALMVLAPRHPENAPRMAALASLLDASGLCWAYRSAHASDPDAAAAGNVMVLDTMGELRGCYRAADLAFVGTDHNVLEPLGFGKPVFVVEGWEPTYPSYPVFVQLRDAGALQVAPRHIDLGTAWLASLSDVSAAAERHTHAADVLAAARGATDRSLAAIRILLD